MSLVHVLTYLPIVAAPAVAIALVWGLQHLLKLPRTARGTSTATDQVVATSDSAVPRLTWDTVATHWNPWVTRALPLLTGLAIVGLGLWPFAYLGWLVIETNPGSGWAQQVPPWFGNPGYFLGFGFMGLMVAFIASLLLGGIGFGLHALGKCLLWPEVCDLCDPPQAATTHTEGHDHDD
ncbi:MAG TPA: hypothetical protein VF292_06375 [Rhodanobacteraceae bacterium]